MIFAIDFDGTIVSQNRAYDDVTSPLVFMPGAREALESLKRAGHNLMLWSARSSPRLIEDPTLDPLVRAGVLRLAANQEPSLAIHRARHKQMLDFVAAELPGIFDAIDDGKGGKPHADYFIDDRAIRFGADGFVEAVDWEEIAHRYGASPIIPATGRG